MDYYQVLGISRDSREKEIKAAFRKIALKYHPDRHSNASPQVKADVAQKFKAATEAYETLIDGKRRALYTARGAPAARPYASRRTYDPRAYSYQGYTAQTPQRGMTRTDGLFHLGLASILIIGTICAGSVGDFIWGHWNRGRLFEHLETTERRPTKVATLSRRAEKPEAQESAPADPSQGQRMPAPSMQSTPGVFGADDKSGSAQPHIESASLSSQEQSSEQLFDGRATESSSQPKDEQEGKEPAEETGPRESEPTRPQSSEAAGQSAGVLQQQEDRKGTAASEAAGSKASEPLGQPEGEVQDPTDHTAEASR